MVYEKFDNGLEAVFEESTFSEVVALHLMVKVGSIHETHEERGLSHFLEHMLFKGTPDRPVGAISGEIESLGGEMNAYTSFDRTVYYMTLPAHNLQKGMQVMADALWNSSFAKEEVEKETQVILEEIRRSQDSPGAIVGRPVFETLYEGSNASRPIIGDEASVEGFRREDLVAFYEKHYRPDNISLILTGHFETSDAILMAKKLFGEKKNGSLSHPEQNPIANCLSKEPLDLKVILKKGDYKQPRLEVAFRGPPQDDSDTPLLDLAAFALGSGDASRLTSRLCHQSDVASSIGASIYSPHFGGIFHVSALSSPETFLKALTGIASELWKIKNAEPISDKELERARSDLKIGKLYREETVSGRARALEVALASDARLFHHDLYEKVIGLATSQRVSEALKRWVLEDKPVISCLLPKDSTLTQEDIKKAYLEGLAPTARPSTSNASAKVKGAKGSHSDIRVIELQNGIKLIHRHHPQKGLFTAVAVTEGGQRAEAKGRTGWQNAIANQLAYGPKAMAYEDYLKAIEGTGSSIEGFSGKDSFGLKMSCLQELAAKNLGIFCETLKEPAFPKDQWAAEKREIWETLRSQEDSPAGTAMRGFQKLIYKDHPYQHPIVGLKEDIEPMELNAFKEEYKSFAEGGPWVFTVVSHLECDKVASMLDGALTEFSCQAQRREFPYKAAPLGPPEKKSMLLDREQCHIVMGAAGLSWQDKDRAALDVLATILGGAGGRLFLRLRDEKGLCYSVSPILTYGRDRGAFGAYMACSPEKVEEAVVGLEGELYRLKKEVVSEKELFRAVEYMVGGHVTDLQRADSQAMTMALMEVYGFGYDDFLLYPDQVRAVTREDVRRVAERVLCEKPFVVTAGPATVF